MIKIKKQIIKILPVDLEPEIAGLKADEILKLFSFYDKIKQTIIFDKLGNVVGDITLKGETLYVHYLDKKGNRKTFYIKN